MSYWLLFVTLDIVDSFIGLGNESGLRKTLLLWVASLIMV